METNGKKKKVSLFFIIVHLKMKMESCSKTNLCRKAICNLEIIKKANFQYNFHLLSISIELSLQDSMPGKKFKLKHFCAHLWKPSNTVMENIWMGDRLGASGAAGTGSNHVTYEVSNC